MEQDPDHGATILMRPPEILDYSLTGHNAERAVELGLAEADWYQSPLPRATMRKFLERKDGPAIRDTLLLMVVVLRQEVVVVSFPALGMQVVVEDIMVMVCLVMMVVQEVFLILTEVQVVLKDLSMEVLVVMEVVVVLAFPVVEVVATLEVEEEVIGAVVVVAVLII